MKKWFALCMVGLLALCCEADERLTKVNVTPIGVHGTELEVGLQSVPGKSTSAAPATAMEAGRETDATKYVSGHPVLHALLTPVGRGGVFLMDKISTFYGYSRGKVADIIGFDANGTFYFILFVAAWTAALVLFWFGIRRIHGFAYRRMYRWKWVRFLSIASGFCCIMYHFGGSFHHPDDHWQMTVVPACGLLLSLVVAFFYARSASWKSNSYAMKALGLVLIDFMLGFVVASLIKVIFTAILLAVIISVVMVFSKLGNGSGSGTRSSPSPAREPSPQRSRPIAPPPPPAPKREESHTYYAEWDGKKVRVYNEYKQFVRQFRARDNVVGVQVSGTNLDNGMVAIAMANGKTDLYHLYGAIARQG